MRDRLMETVKVTNDYTAVSVLQNELAVLTDCIMLSKLCIMSFI